MFAQIKVDKDCDIKDVQNYRVFEDYSCHLQLNDISYTEQDQQTRYIVMQLLERKDGKKWSMWVKTGKLGSDKYQTKVNDFFNKYDAMVEFEQLFNKRTLN